MRAVLVGCGAQSEVWLHAVRENPNVQLVGYVDLNIDAARRRGEPAGTDLAEMLRRVKPDAVFDCTVPAAHKSVTLTAFEHGCHVLGEKPIADSMENARAMVEAARRARRIYAVTQNRRYDPRIRRLKKLLPGLGTLTTINSDFYIGAHFGGFRDQMAHPLLLDMSIHTMDAARFLSGADPVAVYCKAWNPKGSWYAGDAAAVAIFEMTGGIVYTYRGSWCSEGVHTSWEAEWRIIGERGTATWDGAEGFKAQVVAKAGGFHSEFENVPVPTEADKSGAHVGILREFVECVRTGRTPETSGEDNIKSLAMVFGAIESAQTGKRVEIK